VHLIKMFKWYFYLFHQYLLVWVETIITTGLFVICDDQSQSDNT